MEDGKEFQVDLVYADKSKSSVTVESECTNNAIRDVVNNYCLGEIRSIRVKEMKLSHKEEAKGKLVAAAGGEGFGGYVELTTQEAKAICGRKLPAYGREQLIEVGGYHFWLFRKNETIYNARCTRWRLVNGRAVL